MHPAPTITRPLQRLSSTYRREVIQLENDNYRLTDRNAYANNSQIYSFSMAMTPRQRNSCVLALLVQAEDYQV